MSILCYTTNHLAKQKRKRKGELQGHFGFWAHPDDEIIGVGGTIARFKAEGARITVVTFTGRETGHPSIEDREKVRQLRAEESKKCDEILGIDERIVLGRPTQGVVNDRGTYQEFVRIIRRVKPDVIFTHYFEDKHRDHRVVSEITTGKIDLMKVDISSGGAR